MDDVSSIADPELDPSNQSDQSTEPANELDLLRQMIDELRQQNDELEAHINRLQQEAAGTDGNFTYAQFLYQICLTRGGTIYAAATDYAYASRTAGCRAVTIHQLAAWKHNGVPRWAIEQLPRMEFARRHRPTGHEWTAAEQRYLIELCHHAVHPVAELAILCSQHFGRCVTPGAIKGQMTKLHLWIQPKRKD